MRQGTLYITMVLSAWTVDDTELGAHSQMATEWPDVAL